MKTLLKTFYYIFVLLFTVSLVIFTSWFSNFYNNLNYLGLSSIVLQDFSVIIFVVFILVFSPLVIFLIRTKLTFLIFQKKAEISDYHKKVLVTLDILFSLFILVFVILNIKSVYFTLLVPHNFSSILEISDYPFVLSFVKFLVEYFVIVIFYILLPILYYSHKSYIVRFLGLSVFPHKVSFSLILFLFLFVLFISVSIWIYSFVFSLEFYTKYSLILTLGIVVGTLVFLYAFYVFLNLLKNSLIPWYLNLVFVVFLGLYFLTIVFYKDLPEVSIVRFDFLDNIGNKFSSSKFVLKVSKVNVSDVFSGINIGELEKLKNVYVKDYSVIKNREPVVKVIRKAKFLERIYILLSSRTVDLSFKRNLVITNYVNLEKIFTFLPISFSFSSFVNGTNYFEVSLPYEFGNEVFFYSRYLISWTSDKDVKIYDLRFGKNGNLNMGILTAKDYYLVSKRLNSIGSVKKIFFVKSGFEYFVLANFGNCILISNGNYVSFYFNDYNNFQEMFLFLDGVPLFLSNIFIDSKFVGYKVRYFDVSGRGSDVNESISNLIGNAIYYYKVIELTNRIGRLKRYLEENKNNIPPDVFENLKLFLPD